MGSDLMAEASTAIRIAAVYGFAHVADPEAVRAALEARAEAAAVRGTLLVAHEGVNGTIAGPAEGVETVLDLIRAQPGLASPEIKYADADTPPFHRLKVRVKAEIVTMGQPGVDASDAGVRLDPVAWNALIADPGTVIIDTRNDYEAEVGAFAGAVQPNTRTFRDFPDWFRGEGRALVEAGAKVAMYCTGGIRCEKATAFLKAEGVEEVYHLDGGILRYLEAVPEQESLWRGECFVFDERVAVRHGLEPGSHVLCRGCRMPVSVEGRTSPLYAEGVCCARCHDTMSDEKRRAHAERQRQVEIAARRGARHIGVRPPAKGED